METAPNSDISMPMNGEALRKMEERRSRSSSISSSSSSNSWSIIEDPEVEVHEEHELTESELSGRLSEDESLCERKKECDGSFSSSEQPGSALDSDFDVYGNSGDEISVVSESDDAFSEPAANHFIDALKVYEPLDVLSKCYDSPAERLLNQIFESESHLKAVIVIFVTVLSLGFAGIANFAGNEWNKTHSSPINSACMTLESHLLGLQHREAAAAALRASADSLLRPSFPWAVPSSLPPEEAPAFASYLSRKGVVYQKHAGASLKQYSSDSHKCDLLAVEEAVKRYVKHAETLRKEQSKRQQRQKFVASVSEVNNSNSDLSSSPKKEKKAKARANKSIWKNVSASQMQFPSAANAMLHTSALMKIIAESKVTSKFRNALSLVKRSVIKDFAKERTQRDAIANVVTSSVVKIALPTDQKWSKMLQVEAPHKISPPERNDSCSGLTALALSLAENRLFRSLVGDANARMYIESIMSLPLCTETRVSCEKCWWTKECPKTRCSFQPWQQAFNVRKFVLSQRQVLQIPFERLGWPGAEYCPHHHETKKTKGDSERRRPHLKAIREEPVTDVPQNKINNAVQMYQQPEDWLFERSRQREMQRGRAAR